MKLFKQALIFSSVYVCLSAAATNLSTKSQNEHTLYAYKDCEVVKVMPLNDKQRLAYSSLKEEEKHMSQLEFPLEEFEQKMEAFSQQMDEVSPGAVKDDGHVVVINRTLLKKQEMIGEQMRRLVQENQIHLDALEQQGQYIATVAKRFEETVMPSLEGLDYDWITVSTPQKPLHNKCNKARSKM